jgi:hypothetical protein
MTNKLKLLAIYKNEHRSEYVFPKEQKLFGIIREVLYKLNFKDSSLDEIKSMGRPWDEETETPIMDKEEDIYSKNYTEKIRNFYNKEYSVDIIFFLKKVVLVFNYKKDKQQEIAKAMEDFILEED